MLEGRAVGPPCEPIPFPHPKLSCARRLLAPVHFPDDDNPLSQMFLQSGGTGHSHTEEGVGLRSLFRRKDSMAGNVLVPNPPNGQPPERAYWIQRKLGKTPYGSIRVGYVLRPLESDPDEGDDDSEEDETDDQFKKAQSMFWEVVYRTSPENESFEYDMVIVNTYERAKVTELKGKRMGDPIAELAAQQMVSVANSNNTKRRVEGTIETLEDERFMYGVIPHGVDGDLLKYVEVSGGRLQEAVAKHFFEQILEGLHLMHSVGICHRDLSLDNVFLRGFDCYIIPGIMSLKVPYSSKEGESATDRTNGTTRRLMTPQGQCGKSGYIAPEVLSNEAPFDGFAVDIWAAAICLFHMLFGSPPFVWATEDDASFQVISMHGDLRSFAGKWMRKCAKANPSESWTISDAAIDLLQKCLKADPSDRLTLHEVINNPWIKEGRNVVL